MVENLTGCTAFIRRWTQPHRAAQHPVDIDYLPESARLNRRGEQVTPLIEHGCSVMFRPGTAT